MSIYKMRTEFGKYLKPILFVIAAIFLVGAIWSFGTAPTRRRMEGIENAGAVIAKVNGVDIRRGDFEAAYEQAAEEAKNRGMRSPLVHADIKAQVFQQLVNEIVLYQIAKEMGVDISDRRVREEIDKAVTEELKINREAVLGKLSKKRAAVDPRDDAEYKSELAAVGSSLAQQEEIARSKYPPNKIRAMLAQQGIQEKIKARVGRVTDEDVKASYTVYKIRQIMLQTGKFPEEQLMAKARKIVEAARRGADFAKLARENSPSGFGQAGEPFELSFETSFGYPKEVLDALKEMKPGDVSDPIKTDWGIIVIKLEAVTSKMPAKLDKKILEERRNQIRQMREMQAYQELQKRIQQSRNVKIFDPEILAYWELNKAMSAASPAEMKRHRKLAISALTRARLAKPSDPIIGAKLAQLLYEDGRTEEALRILYPMLEGKEAIAEGADLRMLLGDMLVKTGEKERAVEQYKIASEVAINDPATHHQLVQKFEQLKRPDLVAAERKWLDDYNKRLEQFRSMQQGSRPGLPSGGGRPLPKPAPVSSPRK
ncbi:MAG: SurA N-terminal domain-containing protein [Armatimonadota bacterium]|nr:SurA N-terminal domain-containing protein [Armatimonadota bacterium]